MVNVNARVRIKVGDKIYDLKPSENPQKDLPKNVVKALQDGGHLATESTQEPAATSDEKADE